MNGSRSGSGRGWVPFDPTPSRGGVAGAYSASSPAFNLAVAAAILAGKDGLKAFADRRVGLGFPDTQTKFSADIRLSRDPGRVTLTDGHSSAAPSLLRLLLLLLAGAGRPDRGWQARAAEGALPHGRSAPTRHRLPPRAARHPRRPADRGLAERDSRRAGRTHPERARRRDRRGRHARDRRALRAARLRERGGTGAAELRRLRRSLRQELSLWERARGLLSLRSLGLS